MAESIRHRPPCGPVGAESVEANDRRAGRPGAPHLHYDPPFGGRDGECLLSRNAHHALLCQSAP